MKALITTEFFLSHMLTVPCRKVFIITLVRKVASHTICAFEMFYTLVCKLPLNHQLCSGFLNKELVATVSWSFLLLCYSKQSEFGSGRRGEVGVEGWETMLGV